MTVVLVSIVKVSWSFWVKTKVRSGVTSSLTKLGRDNTHMKSNTFTPAYVRQHVLAGVFAIIGFTLSLLGGVWFVSSAGNAGAILNGTAPLWVSAVVMLTALLTIGSMMLASKAFSKAGMEKVSSYVLLICIFVLLAVGQLWHFAM